MYSKRKLLTLVIVALLIMALALSACQTSQTPTDPSDTAPSGTVTPTETDPPVTDPPVDLAAEVKTGDMVFSLQRDNTYMLTSWSGTGDSVTIPATAGEGKVTAVADACFKDLTELKTVVISEGVTKLGNEVFSGCTSLENVTIPVSVTAIGHSAFLGTPWFTVRTSSGSTNWLIVGDGVLLKYYGTGVPEVTVPYTVKYISDAFRGNTELTRITVYSTCKVIGQYAFADCPILCTISLPTKLDYIASSSVVGCPILQIIENED